MLCHSEKLVLLVFCFQWPVARVIRFHSSLNSVSAHSLPVWTVSAVHTRTQPLVSPESLPVYTWVSEMCQPPLPFCGICRVSLGMRGGGRSNWLNSQSYWATLCCVTSNLHILTINWSIMLGGWQSILNIILGWRIQEKCSFQPGSLRLWDTIWHFLSFVIDVP